MTLAAKVLFIHLPKTAGTAFREALLPHLAPQERGLCYHPDPDRVAQKLAEALRRKATFIAAHFDASQLSGDALQGYQQITFLREPAARTVSQYLYIKNSPWPQHAALYQEWGGFEGFLASPYGDNLQCRFLAGYRLGHLPKGRDELYQKACAKLERLAAVGISEHYESSLQRLEKLFGWPRLSRQPLNTGKDQKEAHRLRRDYGPELARRQEADRALYERGCAINGLLPAS